MRKRGRWRVMIWVSMIRYTTLFVRGQLSSESGVYEVYTEWLVILKRRRRWSFYVRRHLEWRVFDFSSCSTGTPCLTRTICISSHDKAGDIVC
ncbi:hypothetical protein BDV11DRAFT_200248 [Aspergillus similis]